MGSRYSVLIFLFIAVQYASSQNVGINIATPEAAMDINGDLILRSADITLSDGVTISVDVGSNPYSNYRINGPSAPFSIAGISNAADGKLLSFFNKSGYMMTLLNEDLSAAVSQRIITGNGSNIDLPNNASVNLQYDGVTMRWIVRSKSGSDGGTGVSGWSLSGNSGTDNNVNFIGTTDIQPVVIKSGNNTVAFLQHGFPNNNYIGTNYQRTGIGMLGQVAPTHTLEVGLADLNGGSLGVLGLRGTNFFTHFNYGFDEHTYIRGGKNGSNILLNDLEGLGNVGIGTSTPYFKIDINGKSRIRGEYTTSGAGGNLTNGGGLLIFNPNDYRLILDGNSIQAESPNSNPLIFDTYASTLVLNPYGGNIGIGTNYNPNRKLEIYRGRMLFTGAQDAQNNIYSGIEFTNGSGNALRGFVGMANDNMIGFYGFAGGGFGLQMNVINGNVGIGTDNPTNKLSVNGTIRSQEIIVETANWPDYVFSDSYLLPSLQSVEKHIKKYKHLPNIPSASEMQENGQRIGEVQKKMMEKIEELMLYIIEQNKRIEKLEDQIRKNE